MRVNGSQPGELNYLIPISNGLLRADHRKRIGSAIWEFFWFIDHTTEEADGVGKVLGGKPITYADLAADLGVSQRTVAEHCKRLAREEYIRMNRTPYGFQVQVLKSKKFFQKRVEETCRSGGERVEEIGRSEWKKSVGRVEETCRSNKTLQDNTVDRGNPSLEEWKALGTNTPIGKEIFRQTWKLTYSNRNGEPISEVMEKTIQVCAQRRILVPPHFYSLKRNVERQEREADTGNHRGLDLPKIEAWE